MKKNRITAFLGVFEGKLDKLRKQIKKELDKPKKQVKEKKDKIEYHK